MDLSLNRLQRKVLAVILTIVVVPMLAAGAIAAEWVSSHFEHRLEQWIIEASRVDRIWLKAYQNDAAMLGHTLARDKSYQQRLTKGDPIPPYPWRHVARSLGLRVIQVYSNHGRLLYSSTPLRLVRRWLPSQNQAVLRAIDHHHTVLAAVGITPIPIAGHAPDFVLLGGLLNRHFIAELSQLTGLDTALYYRSGNHYLDVLSRPGHILPLHGLSHRTLNRLLGHKPDYDVRADTGQFRGLYTPIADSRGEVEAIVFNGLKRGGLDAFMTNRGALFLAISLAGIIIGGLTGLLLSRLVIRPIEDLRNGVMRLAGQNFDATVPIKGNDELGDLGKAFNAMAERLRTARDEQQQRFRQDKLVALGELSAALAHEIRNPIGVISAAAALLEKPEQNKAKQAELIRMIRTESTRVAALVGDFLKLSRNRPPTPTIINPQAPLHRALTAVLATHPTLRPALSFNHGDARILADSDLLQQAWTNLLTNAAEAMGPENGDLTITTETTNDTVIFTLEDSGPGINPEIMPRLFEPFFTTKHNGTGLGLSIAAALIEANNGTLAAVPPKRQGARFIMTFPLLKPVQVDA